MTAPGETSPERAQASLESEARSEGEGKEAETLLGWLNVQTTIQQDTGRALTMRRCVNVFTAMLDALHAARARVAELEEEAVILNSGATPGDGVTRKQPWLACSDCGLPYSDDGWCDCVVPDEVWEQITPSKEHGGVLCLHCMARRITRLGLDDVPIIVASGPFAQDQHVSHLTGERNEARDALRASEAERARLVRLLANGDAEWRAALAENERLSAYTARLEESELGWRKVNQDLVAERDTTEAERARLEGELKQAWDAAAEWELESIGAHAGEAHALNLLAERTAELAQARERLEGLCRECDPEWRKRATDTPQPTENDHA